MNTLHMDVEVVQGTKNTMSNTYEQLFSMVDSMSKTVKDTQAGHWTGNSANEFFVLYDQWLGTMRNLLDQLQQLSTRLQAEIDEWLRMSSSFAS